MSFWNVAGPALIQGGFSAAGNRFAERENRQATLRAQNWADMMSSTEVQRRVRDLKAAGLNPMLAATDGASTPNVPPTTPAPPIQVDVGAQAVNSAQARLLNAQAKLIEAKEPFSAKDAEFQSNILSRQEDEIKARIDHIKDMAANTRLDTESKEFDIEFLQPMRKELQGFINRLTEAQAKGEELGLAEKKAAESMFKKFEELKYVGPFKDVVGPLLEVAKILINLQRGKR